MNLKQQAAVQALTCVRSGMVLGLGSGSTTAYFIDMLAEKLRQGELEDVVGVPTSEKTAARARALGIPLVALAEIERAPGAPLLDLAVDGADEVDPQLNLIKGLGRALLREKIVEMHAERLLVIVDESKIVPRLGTRGPLPVEIVPFAAEVHVRWLNTLGCRAELWREEDGSPAMTDNGNYLARCCFANGIAAPHALARILDERPGIVEHGLFLDMAARAIVAGSGGIRLMEREL
ncbi:MAG: ribose 5-phosphate isomerase A [Anaerolineaceae bacterium 4572_32.1]|nr:MAG: ribose 5-phosphate isomerase A [Anaerolineaceae bacterium 4572_32.1]